MQIILVSDLFDLKKSNSEIQCFNLINLTSKNDEK
jgi:hypothetical protein